MSDTEMSPQKHRPSWTRLNRVHWLTVPYCFKISVAPEELQYSSAEWSETPGKEQHRKVRPGGVAETLIKASVAPAGAKCIVRNQFPEFRFAPLRATILSRGQPGEKQWVIGRFPKTRNIRSVGVFWMDRWQGDVKFPKEWSLEVEQDGKWKEFELYTTDKYDTRANQYNVVHPAAPTKCDAIRIHITPREDTAVGILEVNVEFED